jgi:hypothetical protein
MQPWRYLSGLAAVLALAPIAEASESYDNPAMGGTPCVILQSYQTANGDDSFGAAATLENICGRSVEVSFCLPFATSEEAAEPHCTNGLLRPWATSRIEVSDLPSKLASPNYTWRWHGHLMDSDG